MHRNDGAPGGGGNAHSSSSPPSPHRALPQEPMSQHISPIKKIPRNNSAATTTAPSAPSAPSARGLAASALFKDGESRSTSNGSSGFHATAARPPLPNSPPTTQAVSAGAGPIARRAALPPPPPSRLANRLAPPVHHHGGGGAPIAQHPTTAAASAIRRPQSQGNPAAAAAAAPVMEASQQRQALPERRRPPPAAGTQASLSLLSQPSSSSSSSFAPPHGATNPHPHSPPPTSSVPTTASSTFVLSSPGEVEPHGTIVPPPQQQQQPASLSARFSPPPSSLVGQRSPPQPFHQAPYVVPSVTLSSSPSTISLSPSSHSSMTPPPASLFAIRSPTTNAFPRRVEPIDKDMEARSTEDNHPHHHHYEKDEDEDEDEDDSHPINDEAEQPPQIRISPQPSVATTPSTTTRSPVSPHHTVADPHPWAALMNATPLAGMRPAAATTQPSPAEKPRGGAEGASVAATTRQSPPPHTAAQAKSTPTDALPSTPTHRPNAIAAAAAVPHKSPAAGGLTATYFQKWHQFQQGKSLQSHLHHCAVVLQRHRQRETASVYFIRWLSLVQRQTREEWREEVVCGTRGRIDDGVPTQDHKRKRLNDPTTTATGRRPQQRAPPPPWRVTLLPTPQSAMELAMRYFTQWRRFSRQGTQRRRALVQACGLLTAPLPASGNKKDKAGGGTANNTTLSSLSTSSSSSGGFGSTSNNPRATTPLRHSVQLFAPHARRAFQQWMIWAIRRQASQQRAEYQDEVDRLRAALAEERSERERTQQALGRCTAELEEEKALREQEKVERLQDLEGLRQEFEALQSAALEEREAERQRREEAQKRRFASISPYNSDTDDSDSCSDSDSEGDHSDDDEYDAVDSEGNSLTSPERRERRRRRRRERADAGFATSAFKKACEAYRRKQEESLEEARGWLQQLRSKLRAWNTTEQPGIEQEAASLTTTMVDEQAKQQSVADAKHARRREKRKRRAEAKARQRSVIQIAKETWQEGLRLLHGLQYLQNATAHYYRQKNPSGLSQDDRGGMPSNAKDSPYEQLLARLQGMHQDAVNLRAAAENALVLLRPAPAGTHTTAGAQAAAAAAEMPPGSSKHQDDHGHPRKGISLLDDATSRVVSTPFSCLCADELANTLLLHAQQVTYAYELCCDSLALPRTPPTTAIPVPSSSSTSSSSSSSSSSSAASEAAAKEVAAQLNDIQQAGREFRESRQAKLELAGLLLLPTAPSSGSQSRPSEEQEQVWMNLCTSVQQVVRQHRSAHELLFELLRLLVNPLQGSGGDGGGGSSGMRSDNVEPRKKIGHPKSQRRRAAEKHLDDQAQQWFGVPLSQLRRLLPLPPDGTSSHSGKSHGPPLTRGGKAKKNPTTPSLSNDAAAAETVISVSPFSVLLMALQQRVRGELDRMHCTLQQQLRSVLEAVWEEAQAHRAPPSPSSQSSASSEPEDQIDLPHPAGHAAGGGAVVGIRRQNDIAALPRKSGGGVRGSLGKPPLSKTMRRVAFVEPEVQSSVEESNSGNEDDDDDEEEEELMMERDHVSRASENTASLSALLTALVSWRAARHPHDGPASSRPETPLRLLAAESAATPASGSYHPSAEMAARLRSEGNHHPSARGTATAPQSSHAETATAFPQATRVHLLEETLAQRQHQLERLQRENQALRAELVDMVADTGEDLTVIQSHLAQRYVEREAVEAEREAWEALVEKQRGEQQEEVDVLHGALDRSVAALAEVMQVVFPLSTAGHSTTAPAEAANQGGVQMHILRSAPTATHLKRLVLAAAAWDMERAAAHHENAAKRKKKRKSASHLSHPPQLDTCVWEVTTGAMNFLQTVRIELHSLRRELLSTKDALLQFHRTFFTPPAAPASTRSGRKNVNRLGPSEWASSPGAAVLLTEVQHFLEQQQQRYLEEQCRLHAAHEQDIQQLQQEYTRLEKAMAMVEAALQQEKERQHLWRQKVLGMQEQMVLDSDALVDGSPANEPFSKKDDAAEKTKASGLSLRTPNHPSPTRDHVEKETIPKRPKKKNNNSKSEEPEENDEEEKIDENQEKNIRFGDGRTPASTPHPHQHTANATPAIPREEPKNLPSLSASEASRLLTESLRTLGRRDGRQLYADTVEEVLNVYRTTQQSLYYVVHSYHHKFLPGWESFQSTGHPTTTAVSTSVSPASPSFLPCTESFIQTVLEQMDILEGMDHAVRMLWSKHLPQLLRPEI